MIIREHIRFNKDIKESLFGCLALSFGFIGDSIYLSTVGLDLYRNSILNDLEQNISESKNPLLFINLIYLIKDLEEEQN